MPNFYKMSFTLLVLFILVSLTSCGPKSLSVKDSAIFSNISELELDKTQAPTRVYVRPGAPTLAAYKRFIIDPVKVDYRDPKMKELDPEDILEMQKYFREAMTEELRDGGYVVGTRTEAKTLRISLTISGLKAPSALPNLASTAAAPVAISVGEVTVQGVFRNALANRIDAVVIDRSEGSRVFNPTPWSTWSDVKSSFKKWANGIRDAIDKAHGR
jgi:predicted small lipoprotein YifL